AATGLPVAPIEFVDAITRSMALDHDSEVQSADVQGLVSSTNIRPTPDSTPFPYTTLFRSRRAGAAPARGRRNGAAARSPPAPWRSEEHTSELQSREKLVCRLLLEKKKPDEPNGLVALITSAMAHEQDSAVQTADVQGIGHS